MLRMYKHHRERNELPACYFDNKTEKQYDRSIENFCKNNAITNQLQ